MRHLRTYRQLCLLSLLLGIIGCAKMGKPDGGWYDETPPRVMGCAPDDKATDVHSQKISIYFDEFIKLENATEKVVVSPPQMEAPEIKSTGKRITVELRDTLRENTTYTIDFSDAISDNNEDNPLGNFTYSFSTGSEIDTLEVSGYVVDAKDLEPIKGILVGLYDNLADSAFQHEPMLRVARTDGSGRFVIKGVKSGTYRIYALEDVDANYFFSQKSERLAFTPDLITPSFKPDFRQDTIWRDSLHIQTINRVGYTHFLPDDIVLRAFTETLTNRYLIKKERKDADRLSFYFSYGHEELPVIEALNFNADALLLETNQHHDTLTYWITDTALVNQDTLRYVAHYLKTDSTGALVQYADTAETVSKSSYVRRMKEQAKEEERWRKQQEKRKKKGQPYDSVMPRKELIPKINVPTDMLPTSVVQIEFPTPIFEVNTEGIHLFMKNDTVWNPVDVAFEKSRLSDVPSYGPAQRYYEVRLPNDSLWKEGGDYSLELDSAAFTDIYGHVNGKTKKGMRVKDKDDFTTITLRFDNLSDTTCVVQLLSKQDKVVAEVSTQNGVAVFNYVKPGTYYVRLFVDSNRNGLWDTGDFVRGIQGEMVYYYPEKIECKAKWEVNNHWGIQRVDPSHLKPSEITKQKPDKEKKIKQRNLERARKLGIEYLPKIMN
ncbi:MAG: Ig-like domain-containing protein [Prevotella sp.]|nr:Ig-like domain-containing protein [Prevotella sp.]